MDFPQETLYWFNDIELLNGRSTGEISDVKTAAS